MPLRGHEFGGAWTELKLDAVTGYLSYYTNVLKAAPRPDNPFKLWYVDAFAGSGTRTSRITRGGILEGTYVEDEELELAGSAKRALAVQPPFQRLVFIEGHRGRFRDLSRLIADHPDRNIDCHYGEANAELEQLFRSAPWANQSEGRGSHRAVVFLDPYGMNVRWSTLKMLAATRAVDVWYLVPLEGVNRQLARKLDRVDENKRLALDQIFGTPDWEAELYATETKVDLFDEVQSSTDRTVTKKQIETYAVERLQSIFSYVSVPMPLLAEGRGQQFSLFCLANPSSHAARALIDKGVKWVLRTGGRASHHTSDP
jgi:three-Cys-motif partner protein